MKADLMEADSATLLIAARSENSTDSPIARQEREEKIRIRAYEIYLERGDDDGSDIEDWLRAEIECFSSAQNDGLVLADSHMSESSLGM